MRRGQDNEERRVALEGQMGAKGPKDWGIQVFFLSKSWLDITEVSPLWVVNPILVYLGGSLFWITYRATSVVLTRCPPAVTSGSTRCPVEGRPPLPLWTCRPRQAATPCVNVSSHGSQILLLETVSLLLVLLRWSLHLHLQHKVSSTSPFDNLAQSCSELGST